MNHSIAWVSIASALCGAFALPAAAANLIPNPDFTNGVDGWTTVTAGNGTATLDGSTGDPDAPSIRLVANPANSNVTVASTCVQIDDGEELYGFFNLRGNAGAANISIDIFSDVACATALGTITGNPTQANRTWTTYAFEGVSLPNGAKSAKILLTATEGADAAAGDANFDHVQLGQSGNVLANVNVNQEGLSGTWYNPLTSGQGLQFTFDPDTSTPGNGNVFGTWYTYDTTSGDESSQRWYSIQAALTGDGNGVGVNIYQNTGGNFDAPPVTNAVQVGIGSLFFDSCQSGIFIYSFDDGRTGSFPLSRIMPNVDCVDTGTPTITPSDFGLSGTWYDPATAGQGMLIEVNPVNAYAFFGWYTYAASGQSSGVAGQRWFTAQAPYTVGTHVIDLTVYDSTGGTFDSSIGVVQTVPVGDATLTYTSCSSATLDYTFTAGELDGQSGTIALSRLGNAPASCPTITQ
jgi:hypothetical protein